MKNAFVSFVDTSVCRMPVQPVQTGVSAAIEDQFGRKMFCAYEILGKRSVSDIDQAVAVAGEQNGIIHAAAAGEDAPQIVAGVSAILLRRQRSVVDLQYDIPPARSDRQFLIVNLIACIITMPDDPDFWVFHGSQICIRVFTFGAGSQKGSVDADNDVVQC